MNSQSIPYRLFAIALRAVLVLALVGTGWFVYKNLPSDGVSDQAANTGKTTVRVIVRPSPEAAAVALDISVKISPVDLVAIDQEYRADPHTGKRFEEFRNERMNGRTPVIAQLNKQGEASVNIPPGDWWVQATLPGDRDLEWRLGPITITGYKQTIELTPENAYTRSKTF